MNDPHAHWITSDDGLSRYDPAPHAAKAMVPNSIKVELKQYDGEPDFIYKQRLNEYYGPMMGKPAAVAWQYRWTNPGDYPHQHYTMFDWKSVEPTGLQTMEDKVRELRAYRHNDKPCYEVRALGVIPGL